MSDISAAAAELVERTTKAQGLPVRVDDPAAIARIAAIARTPTTAPGSSPEAVTITTLNTATARKRGSVAKAG